MSKKIKKTRVRKTKKSNVRFVNVILLIFCTAVILAGFYKTISPQFKAVKETSLSFQKKVPVEVYKKKINVVDSFRVPILMYHYVEYVKDRNDTIRQSLNIDPDIFDEQISTLSKAGYTFMTASELAEVIDGKKEMPVKPVLITIDDGHWDVDTVILPILKKYDAKATAYVISGFINNSDFLTETQLKDLINSGIVEIGAHTVHHVSLRDRFGPIVKYEIEQSKKDLESKYGVRVVSFAYPDGAFDQQAIDSVKSSGYTSAVSTIPGIVQDSQSKYYLYRLRPGRRVGNGLINFFNQAQFRNW